MIYKSPEWQICLKYGSLQDLYVRFRKWVIFEQKESKAQKLKFCSNTTQLTEIVHRIIIWPKNAKILQILHCKTLNQRKWALFEPLNPYFDIWNHSLIFYPVSIKITVSLCDIS